MTDDELAGSLAEAAGRILLELRGGSDLAGPALGRAGDAAANAFILAGLRQARPDDAILSEESPDDRARLACARLWIIDPLDGTREYGEGRDDWAVHVALAIEGRPTAGAVAVPGIGRCFVTGDGWSAPHSNRPRPKMLVSRSRPPSGCEELASFLGAELAMMGSAGAKAAAVIAGEADIYFHSGGQHEWDNCAPAAVALSAGLAATRIDGSLLLYNRADSLVPDLVIASPELAARVANFFQR